MRLSPNSSPDYLGLSHAAARQDGGTSASPSGLVGCTPAHRENVRRKQEEHMALPPIHIPISIPDGKLLETLDVGEAARSALCGTSNNAGFPGVWGIQNEGGPGVVGSGGETGEGVYGEGKNGVHGKSKSPTDSGVWGENTGGGYGVSGSTTSDSKSGMWGSNGGAGYGVVGTSKSGDGVFGQSPRNGVTGNSSSDNDSGVWGFNAGKGNGVTGDSNGGTGVLGQGATNGVTGNSSSDNDSGVWGFNSGKGYGVTGTSTNGIGVLGQGGRLAGRFQGNVEVTGDIQLINGDCAEDFDILSADEIGPGTVMVITTGGALDVSRSAYDRRVAGVVSGAGNLKPGIILGRQEPRDKSLPIALLGKVYCKVDASYSAVKVGDLLTSSPTPGYAMKAADPLRAFGSVIGKALRPLDDGQVLIPILIALQ
jgi:hypothetical protein